ncbi:Isoleucine--tRNA ligase, partial [Bienertia sinuspersici]
MEKEAGVAGVCRDHNGRWIKGSNSKVFCPSALHAESWGNIILASDCLNVVQLMKSKNPPKFDLFSLLHQCRELQELLPGVKLEHEPRQANHVADTVAKLVKKNAGCLLERCILITPPLG